MNILYLATAGRDDPTRACLALHLAVNGSLEVGHTPSVVLAGAATDLVIGDTALALEAPGLPPARELLEKARHRVPVYV